jgi:hypothetical protein
MDVIVRRGSEEHRIRRAGQTSMRSVHRLWLTQHNALTIYTRRAVFVAAGEAFDAQDFWYSLSPEHLVVEIL